MDKRIIKILKNPGLLFCTLGHREWFNWMDDKSYLQIVYRVRMHKRLNLDNPQTFNEKLQWLKLYDRKPKYTMMVDKYAAKQYVANLIGEEYVIPTLGVWDRADDIEWDKLPNQFVMKVTHDSGGLIICRDKCKLDIKSETKKMKKGLKRNYFNSSREWPYKNVPRKIIAEQYMEDSKTGELGLRDYKFYCFDGVPKFLYVSEGLEDHSTAKISFLTTDWQFAPFHRSDYAPFETLPQKPTHFNEMFQIASKLSEGHAFLRVDLYEINGRVYFSELTFFPCSGMMPFEPKEWDEKLGCLINLQQKQ